MTPNKFKGQKAIILGTGPSLADQADDIHRLQRAGYKVFGVNNTFEHFWLDVWIACDPKWHEEYGIIKLQDCDKYHWDKEIAKKYQCEYIEGKWDDGLSVDPNYIHYGHSSGYQALNLAVLYGCSEIYLCGFDMNYNGSQRHYFNGLSCDAGEYPKHLRKNSTFDGLIRCYWTITKQSGLPPIYNCKFDSSLECFTRVPIGMLI